MKYKARLLEDDTRFKLRKGDLLEVEPYILDPEKLVVIKRLRDEYCPGCTQYRKDLEIIKDNQEG